MIVALWRSSSSFIFVSEPEFRNNMFAKKGTHERLVLCHTTLHFMPESVKNDATDERLEMPAKSVSGRKPIPCLTLTVSE
jgi:hypothetical protein